MNYPVNHKVAILLAVYNGGEWLREQLDSLLAQSNVNISIFISIDSSVDNSGEVCEEYSRKFENVTIISMIGKSGGGSKNFYRLIQSVDITGFDYITFADQDDTWQPDKLIRHIQLARQHGADGVSSNVIAFWPDGKQKLIVKSQPQRKFDYLFESAGPGCTFLMTPWLVKKVRNLLMDEKSPAKEVALHDWLTYAVCRANGRKWVIDAEPTVNYRQHSHNVVGANIGFKAKLARLQKLRQGWYREEVIKIAQVCNCIAPNKETSKLLDLMNSKNLFSQLKLLAYVPKARRSLVGRGLLAISIVIGLF